MAATAMPYRPPISLVKCLLAAPVGDADTCENQSDGGCDGLHADADALEDRGGGAGLGLLSDVFHGLVVIRGVVLSGLAERPADEEAADDRDRKTPRLVGGIAKDPIRAGHVRRLR